MSGARPSQFKKGGGRLNNVAATITGIEWTGDELVYTKGESGFSRVEFTPGKVKKAGGGVKDKFHALNALVSLRVDGATEDTIEPMFAGGADDFAISEDGQELWDAAYDTPEAAEEADQDPANKVRGLGANTKFWLFLDSLSKAGFPEVNLPEHRLTFGAIVGTRVQIIQRDDPAMKGKKKLDASGKESKYGYTYTAVDDVLALPEVDEVPVVKGGKKTTAKAAPVKTVAGKKAPVAPVVEEVDLDGETTLALLDALAQKSPQKVGDLSMWVLKNRMKHPEREAIRSRIVTPTFLATEDGWVYDKAAKMVTLAESE